MHLYPWAHCYPVLIRKLNSQAHFPPLPTAGIYKYVTPDTVVCTHTWTHIATVLLWPLQAAALTRTVAVLWPLQGAILPCPLPLSGLCRHLISHAHCHLPLCSHAQCPAPLTSEDICILYPILHTDICRYLKEHAPCTPVLCRQVCSMPTDSSGLSRPLLSCAHFPTLLSPATCIPWALPSQVSSGNSICMSTAALWSLQAPILQCPLPLSGLFSDLHSHAQCYTLASAGTYSHMTTAPIFLLRATAFICPSLSCPLQEPTLMCPLFTMALHVPTASYTRPQFVLLGDLCTHAYHPYLTSAGT